jgi:hypothetical protein
MEINSTKMEINSPKKEKNSITPILNIELEEYNSY